MFSVRLYGFHLFSLPVCSAPKGRSQVDAHRCLALLCCLAVQSFVCRSLNERTHSNMGEASVEQAHMGSGERVEGRNGTCCQAVTVVRIFVRALSESAAVACNRASARLAIGGSPHWIAFLVSVRSVCVCPCSLLGIVGKDFVLLAADRSPFLSLSISTASNREERTTTGGSNVGSTLEGGRSQDGRRHRRRAIGSERIVL
jgi:hypothetical protein